SLTHVAEFAGGTGDYASPAVAQGYSIDSRTIRSGELFFAVKGERLDGHDFVEQALRHDAVAAVVRRDQLARYPAGTRLLAVEDPLVALQKLATSVRRLWGKPKSDRKSTRLNSSHVAISYAVFCLKKKK